MKRNLFVITEEEKRRILGLHESATKRAYLSEQTQYVKDANGKVSVLQGPLAIPQGMTAIDVDTYNMAMKNGGIIPPTPAGPQNNPAATTTPTTATTTPTTGTTTTSKFGVDYKYNYPGDKSYVYGYKDGKWYTKNVAKNAEFDLSTNPKWKSTIDNLNKQFASQIKAPTTPTTATTASTTGTTASTTGTTATLPTLPTLPLSGITAQSNLSNQQLATGPLKSGQEIRQDYRQQQRQERQGARQERRDVRKMEQDLKNLQATYQRLQGKMTPQVKLGYENQIKQLQTQIGQQG